MRVEKRKDDKFEILLGSGPVHVLPSDKARELAHLINELSDIPDMVEGTDYTDGQWIATTMGQFIQILVDSGHDPCIIFRVDEDSPNDGEAFVRKMTVLSVPNGQVINQLRRLGMVGDGHYGVYKVLKQLIEAGLVD